MLRQVNIRDYWDKVKPTLIPILDTNEIVEDIYAACINGKAFLFVSDYGYCILQEHYDVNGKSLFIWKASVWTNERNLIKTNLNDIVEIAKATGCKSVRFISNRKGYQRVFDSSWKMSYQFRKEIE